MGKDIGAQKVCLVGSKSPCKVWSISRDLNTMANVGCVYVFGIWHTLSEDLLLAQTSPLLSLTDVPSNWDNSDIG